MQSDLHRFSFCGPGALLPHFILREQVILFISVIQPWGRYYREASFPRKRPKNGFTCLPFETGSKFFTTEVSTCTHYLHQISFCGPGANIFRFTLCESKFFCSSQWIIRGGSFKKKQIVHRLDQKSCFNLSTLRNTFQLSLLLKFHHAIRSSWIFFLRPWCTSTPF